MNLLQLIQSSARRYFDDTVRIRRHLHAHPELSFEEFETSEFIASCLSEYGISVQRLGEGTGLVADIIGRGTASPADPPVERASAHLHPHQHEKNTDGAPTSPASTAPNQPRNIAPIQKFPVRTVALRADMDALPIAEENPVEFRSRREGVMHACGHDVHSAVLVSAARILQEQAEHFSGRVRLIFQPAEERCPGGARGMIEQGVLDNVDVIFGEHVNPTLPAGSLGFRSGVSMASADEIYMKVHGRGGHAAFPHTLVDPVLITSHILTALQQIVSRQSRADNPCVLSFGRVDAPGAMNVIPNTVSIAGTFRAVDEAWREQALVNIQRMAETIAEGMGGRCEVNIVRGYPALVNNADVNERCRGLAQEWLSEWEASKPSAQTQAVRQVRVYDLPLAMWSEDFAYYNQKVPGCFYNLGVGNEAKGYVHPVHSPLFMVDESAMELGSGFMAFLALSFLNGDFSG